MPYGKPANKILVAGTPIVDECVTEGTNVKPGLLVVKGTSDNQVVLAGAGALNVLGVIDVDSRYNMAEAFPDKHPLNHLNIKRERLWQNVPDAEKTFQTAQKNGTTLLSTSNSTNAQNATKHSKHTTAKIN
jgi:hypothetical protein